MATENMFMLGINLILDSITQLSKNMQYILYGRDGNDEQALERRMSARPSHFRNAAELKRKGHFIFGGAILDDQGKMIGSTMIMQFDDEKQLRQWLDTEPYITNKVWEKYELLPFRVAEV
jgi:uncharacterized protein YciI